MRRWALDEQVIQGLAYPDWSPGGRLSRVDAPVVELVPQTAILRDRASIEATESAAALMTEATEGKVVFRAVSQPTGAGPVVDVGLASPPRKSLTDWALLQYAGNRVVGATGNLGSLATARAETPLLHALGYVLGVGHTPRFILLESGFDVMADSPLTLGISTRFSLREKLVIRMMLLRPPGNAFPDVDQDLPVSASSVRRTVVAVPCTHGISE